MQIKFNKLVTLITLVATSVCFDLTLQTFGQSPGIFQVYKQGSLLEDFNNSQYQRLLSCRNGGLKIIEYQKGNLVLLQFTYYNLQNGQSLQPLDILVQHGQNPEPAPTLKSLSPGYNGTFSVSGNCPVEPENDNYFNDVVITITPKNQSKQYKFSFLLNCDVNNRHKQFQIGYLVLALLNTSIIIGVALYSRIWSIRLHGRPLSFELTWILFVTLVIIISIGALLLYLFTYNQLLSNGTLILRYVGLASAFFFSFICLNQIFFLVRTLKSPVYKFIRKCDIFSLFGTFAVIALGSLVDNFIVTNILGTMICVGSIKMLKFRTLFQSIVCMGIYVLTISATASIFHYVLKQSYNDYASQLSSPLFLQFPDLVNNLYKKCSWLPVFQVILPGVMLSFLRSYDQNYGKSCGGVYTVIGNAAFVVSTVIWITVQMVYPYSVPFALVTYPLTLAAIIAIAFKRNDLKNLMTGRFNTARQSQSFHLPQDNQSFSDMVGEDLLKTPQVHSSINQSQEQEKQNQKQVLKEIEPQI